MYSEMVTCVILNTPSEVKNTVYFTSNMNLMVLQIIIFPHLRLSSLLLQPILYRYSFNIHIRNITDSESAIYSCPFYIKQII